jgi:hypothetical protein
MDIKFVAVVIARTQFRVVQTKTSPMPSEE